MIKTVVKAPVKMSAPGSMMLFGEHSVLRGKHAIVLALAKRIYVTLEPRSDHLIRIDSHLGQLATSLSDIVVHPPFQYVLQTLQSFPPSCGLNITITSEMSSTMGVGTSAAVVVALLGGLATLSGKNTDQLFTNALQIVRHVQGLGSGADIMASIKGGIGLYRANQYQSLPMPVTLFAAYSGSKMATPEVVHHVSSQFANYPQLLQSLDDTNDVLALEAAKCLTNEKCLGELLNAGAGIMEAFGVHTKQLAEFLWKLREQSHGVKLSGSGLGDCAIGVMKNGTNPEGSFPIIISPQGLKVETI
jgi:mevalonate kinase